MSARGDRSALEQLYWESVIGSSPDAQRLEELNGIFGHHVGSLLAAAGRPAPCEIFVGGYPIHSTNAFVSPQQEGALILVHEGLLEFAFVLGSILAASVPAVARGHEKPPELPERAANALIAGTITALVSGRPPLPYELRDTSRQPFASFLMEYLVEFVLAHEIAHVLLGHLASEPRAVRTAANQVVPIDYPRWEDELAADALAFELVSAILPDRITMESRYMPATLYLELIESESAVRAPRDRGSAAELARVADLVTHPRATHRRSALVVTTHPDGPLAVMARIDAIVERMAAARGRPLSRADREALDRLLSRSSGCDPHELETVLGAGTAISGVTYLDLDHVRAFLAEDVERAKSAVAMAAFGAGASPYATRELFGMRLGALTFCAPDAVFEDEELWALVVECVPDVAELNAETARLLQDPG